MGKVFERIWPILHEFSGALMDFAPNRWTDPGSRFFNPASIKSALHFIRMIAEECSMDVRGKVIVDAGCGLGENTILLALLGAERVYGIDIDEERIGVFRKALEHWRQVSNSDWMDRVELRVQDITTFTPPERANLVLSLEMVSHLWDRKAFYQSVAGMLARGGRLFASDGNNGANPKIAAERKEIWRRAERQGGRIYEARKRFILSEFPTITDENALGYLTSNTCYQQSAELLQNVKEYLSSGQLKTVSKFSDDRAPYDPEYCFLPNEDLVYPAHEAQCIRAAGLEPQIIPYFMGAKRQYLRPLNKMLAVLPELAVRYARALHIIAAKP